MTAQKNLGAAWPRPLPLALVLLFLAAWPSALMLFGARKRQPPMAEFYVDLRSRNLFFVTVTHGPY